MHYLLEKSKGEWRVRLLNFLTNYLPLLSHFSAYYKDSIYDHERYIFINARQLSYFSCYLIALMVLPLHINIAKVAYSVCIICC